ncbi:MAG: WYL domain-containing protein [Bacteroidetes bacterium]|nr:WYL domain-containing protein [Bacteroidota bacterium]
MSKKEYFLRHNLIINKLRRYSLNFGEITDYLKSESELQGYTFVVSKRTFQRDLEDIRATLDIDIQFDPSLKKYYIAEENEELSNTKNRMLEAYDLFNALNRFDNLGRYLQFEKRKPKGTQHFYGLLHAIKNHLQIEMTHQGFWKDRATTRLVKPLLLKESVGRWYLLAEETNGAKKIFGLDRVSYFTITKKVTNQYGQFSVDINNSDRFANKIYK